jgi:hypothetical protein
MRRGDFAGGFDDQGRIGVHVGDAHAVTYFDDFRFFLRPADPG